MAGGIVLCAGLLLSSCRSSDQPEEASDAWGTLEQPDSEKLPKAMSVKASSADDAAVRLAVAARSEDPREAVAALLTALQMAGFAVVDPDLDGRVVRPAAQPAQGISVQPGEVIAMQRLLARGHTVLARDAAEIIRAASAPAVTLDAARIEELLLAGVREHAAGDHATLRFWARFIVELGRQGPDKIDLLAAPGEDPRDLLGSEPPPVRLDAAQFMLITWRLAADMNGFAHRAGTPDPAGNAAVKAPVLHASILPASIFPAPRFGALLRAATASTSDCNFSEEQSPMMDAISNAASYGFGELIGYIGKNAGTEAAQKAIESSGKVLNAVGQLLGFAKVFLAAALTEAKLEFVDDSNELRRLKSSSPNGGERKEVRATVRLNAGGWRYLNCSRIALNALGLDASLPNDGAIKGAKLTWWVDAGDQSRMEAAQNALIRYKGNIVNVKTDEAGQVVATIEGMPQERDIEGRPAEIRKSATIGYSYGLKESELTQDLVDAVFSLVGGPAGIVAEMFHRTVSKGVIRTFTVIDYGSDYRIDHVINGVRFTAEQCGTPTGIWEIDISGELGMGMSVNGQIYVGINERSYNGRFRGELNVNVPEFARQYMSFDDIGFSGVAALAPSSSRLLLETRDTQGALKAANATLPIAGPGSNLSLPFETGAFCTGK